MKGSFTITSPQGRQHRVRTASTFRYVAWVGRDDDVTTDSFYRAIKPEIVRRSDSYIKAAEAARKVWPRFGWAVVVDTHTGDVRVPR